MGGVRVDPEAQLSAPAGAQIWLPVAFRVRFEKENDFQISLTILKNS
jgi:hypothetical protein